MLVVNETQLRIIDALVLLGEACQDLQKITMEQIAKKAGIKRQNIYKKHFSSIKDMIDTMHQLVDQKCQEKISEFVSANDQNLLIFIAKEILPLIYEKRRWLSLLYNSAFDPYWRSFLQAQYLPLAKKYRSEEVAQKCEEIEVESDFLYHLMIDNILSLIGSWIVQETPEQPYIFQKKFLKLSAVSLNKILD